MGKKPRHAPELPLDVLPEILSRVPAESLVRFKCVCKSWYGLISDEGFVRSHLEHWRSAGQVQISGGDRPHDPGGREGKIRLRTLNLEDEEAQSHLDQICIDDCLVHALPLNVLRMPVHVDDVGVVFLDSCDGLVLLRVDDLRSTATAPQQHLLVCNPITKWYMLLPPCDHPSFKITDFRWFIASHDPAQCYKIIGIKHRSCNSQSPASGGWCFNLEFRQGESAAGSWKELPADRPWSGYLWLLPPSLSVGRKVHWLTARDKGELVLLSLDLSTERLTLTETLNSPRYTAWGRWFLSDRAMCFGKRIQFAKEIEVWILEDFDRPVWRKHHMVTSYPQVLEFPSRHYDLSAMVYMKEEDELIMRIGRVGTFVYKMSSQEWRRIVPPAEGNFNSVLTYHHRPHVNSLVGCGRWNRTICVDAGTYE